MNTPALSSVPQTGLAGLKENWQSDLQAGFLVFLIALPLCLGVSLASGFPPSAGILSAIIGGLLVSRLSGSHLKINGPAAGLIVVIFDAVQALGEGDAMAGYRFTLAAIVVAGILQVLMGRFRIGKLSSFFPASVVHGMLAAIGLIIIISQSHVMLGVTPEAGSLFSTALEIPHSLFHMKPEIFLISFLGLLLLIVWPLIGSKIPAAIMVVLVGMLAKLAIDLVRGVWLRNLFKIHFTIRRQDDDTLVVKLLGSALFSNFLPLKKALAGLEPGKTIIFDFTDGYLIDHTVMEFIHDFRRNYEDRGGHCRKVGKALETFSDHALAARLMTADDRE